MKKKRKINKKKFLRRILFLLIIIILLIILIKKVVKTDRPKFDISVIVNKEDITENLEFEPYIDKDKTLYLSLEDIQKVFDKNIFYENSTNKIITTSRN